MNIAVYAASKELYPFLLGGVKSMLKNGGADKVYLIIEDDKFPEDLPPEIEVINFSGQKFFGQRCPNLKLRFTYMTLARAVLAKILPVEVEKVLSMDCDTIVQGSLEEVWNKDISDYLISATPEPYMCRWEKTYYNTGVCLMNLKKIREMGIDDRMIKLINSTPLKFPEQDALNQCCDGYKLPMPSEFNYNDYVAKPFEEVRVRHYAGHGVQVWGYLPDVQHYLRMPWDEVFRNKRRST